LDPLQNQEPLADRQKFVTDNYVVDLYTHVPNLEQIRPRGVLRKLMKYNENLFIGPTPSGTQVHVRPVSELSRLMAKMTWNHARM